MWVALSHANLAAMTQTPFYLEKPRVARPEFRLDGIEQFKSEKVPWRCYMFPVDEPLDGCVLPITHLWAEGSALAKLDRVFGTDAWNCESWVHDHSSPHLVEGHSFEASDVSIVFEEPKRSVAMIAKDGSLVKFSRNDIQGLLVKMAPTLIIKESLYGKSSEDYPHFHYVPPEHFMATIRNWAREGLPFVVSSTTFQGKLVAEAVDYAKIEEVEAPPDFAGSSDNVTHYRIELSGDALRGARVYRCFIQRDHAGKIIFSSWVGPENTSAPHSIWRPRAIGDLREKCNWQLRPSLEAPHSCRCQSYHRERFNPGVDPQAVFEIYMKSIE